MTKSPRESELARRVQELERELEQLKHNGLFQALGNTVSVPDELRPPFEAAQETVRQYFSNMSVDPTQATINISGDRYVLVRASSLSVEFLNTIKNLYADLGEAEAFSIGRNILFDIAHVIGVEDVRNFHKKMGVTDPVAKLSAGPVLFAYFGWAFVELSPESRPQANQDYFIKYDHPFSFEADSWLKAGQSSQSPVCIMNCGYSSGWCEESFGFPLTSVEISCRAAGDERCTFIMAPPDSIEDHLKRYVAPSRESESHAIQIPTFFERKRVEEEMRAARLKAEDSDRMKSEFLANMSHEIRTPMNAIIGMTELVLDTELTHTQRDYLEIVTESAETLLTIINEILDFSKIESGQVSLENIEFELREEIGDTLKLLGMRAHAKSLDLVWRVDPKVPEWLKGDPLRLRQMIVNLVSNAIKFTEQGEVAVEISAPSITEKRVELEMVVRDTGVGIEAVKLESIFTAFQQADASVTRRFGGTGLGLSITSRIVEMMGGKIWVESEVGKGSTFRVRVQLEPTDNDSTSQVPTIRPADIVIAERNDTARDFLRDMVTCWGLPVTTADSAKSAMQLLTHPPSNSTHDKILILDEALSANTDASFLQQLRQDRELQNIKVILLTSLGKPLSAEMRRALPVDCQLSKPVKPSELLDAIHQTLLEPEQEAVSARPSPDKSTEYESHPLRVLVAEDGIANQKMARGLLSKWGYQVDIVENGREAIAAWQTENYDCILMDVQMPLVDGLSATKEIRRLERDTGARIPIVAMTARAMKGDREKCLEVGMDDYVSKPIRRHELARALRRIAQRITKERGHGSQPSVVDWDQALEVAAGDSELLKEVLQAACDEVAHLFQVATNSLQHHDFILLQRTAHRIKGASMAIAAEPIGAAAEALEVAAFESNPESCAEALAELAKLRITLDREIEIHGWGSNLGSHGELEP